MSWKYWDFERNEFNAHPDLLAAFGQFFRQKKFVIAKPAIGRFDNVFRRAEFVFRIGINARVPAREIPGSRRFEPAHFSIFQLRNENFRALIWKLVVEFSPQHHADVFWIQFQIEFGNAGHFPADIALRRINFLSFQRVHAEFVAGNNFIRLGRAR